MYAFNIRHQCHTHAHYHHHHRHHYPHQHRHRHPPLISRIAINPLGGCGWNVKLLWNVKYKFKLIFIFS